MDPDQPILLNQPVVIDNGSGSLKSGFAGDDKPKFITSSIIGRPKYSKIMAGALEGDTFIGNRAQENRGLLSLKYPISHGVVENWDDMELLWSNIFSQNLKINAEEHPILLTEAPLNPSRHREKCSEIFFETFNIPALYISVQAVLALYSSGRTTGVVLDSGDGVSHVVPVYEGFSLPSAIRRIDVAGRDITEQLQFLLRKSGYMLMTSSEKEIVRIIKEKNCFISENPRKDENEWINYLSTNPMLETTTDSRQHEIYKLPDGKIINLGPERFRATEILFHPQLIGSEFQGIHEILSESILKVDLELRPSLYKSIVLSGGTTLFKGFGNRLLNELKNSSEKNTKIKIYAPPERKYSTWIGGSILAGLSTFKKNVDK
ncbi:hypothetical protein PACTADRAFT_48214 [Pachysolen tannophilus NRRL Y-2460]|uniref:Centractin n=1 Tax=Pachysolen tannophilus NRRL Y-2460 TaxID=669874 RepID=A0A1E4U371_PACTA|nr:hypothetical protein PACTADRAFT_48214 [Pachysolen tannophilus NRRL Y-2460]